jgi:hypothetical protein
MRLKRLISPALAFLLVMGVILLSAAPLLAFVLGEQHWDTDYAPFDNSDLPTRWQAAVWEAGSTWNRAPADFDFAKSSYTDNTWTAANYGYGHLAFTNRWVWIGTNILAMVKTAFNTYWPYSIGGGGGTYDVQTVALHEFGHWLVLLDIPKWQLWHMNKVMYGDYVWVKRTLHQDDINGIVSIYGQE